MGEHEGNAILSDPIQVGCGNVRVAIGGQSLVMKLVCVDEDNVGSGAFLCHDASQEISLNAQDNRKVVTKSGRFSSSNTQWVGKVPAPC